LYSYKLCTVGFKSPAPKFHVVPYHIYFDLNGHVSEFGPKRDLFVTNYCRVNGGSTPETAMTP